MCGLISGISILFQWSLYLFLLWYLSLWLLSLCSIVWSQGAWCLQLCSFSRLFGYLGSLCFYTNFKITFSSSVKNTIVIFIGIALNLYINLGSMDILTVFRFMNAEYFFVYLCCLQFLSLMPCSFQCRSFTSLVKVVPSCFILFDAIANEIVFLISLFW